MHIMLHLEILVKLNEIYLYIYIKVTANRNDYKRPQNESVSLADLVNN